MKPLLLVLLCVSSIMTACAGKRPLERFADEQAKKMRGGKVYNEADFDFSAAVYEPTMDDLEKMRATWIEHGGAFPESRSFAEVEKETIKSGQRVVLVSLFMTDYDKADLRDKALGWSISPVPVAVKELSETDVVLRTLMPVRNPWARYFLLRYSPETLSGAAAFTVSNRTSSMQLKR